MVTLMGRVSEDCRPLRKAFEGGRANEKLSLSIPGHSCAASQAFLIEVYPEQEFTEEPFDKLEEGVVEDHEDCKEEARLIAIHAIGGCSSPQAVLVEALIGDRELVALIDSGATCNFLKQELANSVGLAVTPIAEFDVKVANGERLVCTERYEQVSITIQTYQFSTTLYSLPLSGPDLILGLPWLASLGRVVCNWSKGTMRFKRDGVRYVIRSCAPNPIQEAMQMLERGVQGGGELFAIMQKGEDNDIEKDLEAGSKDEFLSILGASGEYFEKFLRLAINKQGTDEAALPRVFTSRAEIDMKI